ncbi:uncharacterized protein M6B38_128560 [Iris pallida]|uniref:DUF674 family protein n=1 Tax=Iris pallida TaxID=29817 RepID=A0AAX6EQ90_IRIPA|nr:uncharacterized protein M6B38_176900 [Iris pallida]KAJ6823611.1 uncharacterized protein M6B38_128560 [Iris pallida]
MASQQQQLMLKLLIDNSSDKVLFAEAGKDVVDFLFSLLSIPVGTVVKLLATEGMPMVGCIGNLYKSVERLDDSCLQSGHARTMLLNPTLPSAASITKNTLSLTGASPGGGALPAAPAVKFYRCTNISSSSNTFGGSHFSYVHGPVGTTNCGTYTSCCGTTCPVCRKEMRTEMTRVQSDSVKEVASAAAVSAGEAGFVKGVVTYTVTDDLSVTKLSSISSITMLTKHNVRDLGSLEERVVKIGMKEPRGKFDKISNLDNLPQRYPLIQRDSQEVGFACDPRTSSQLRSRVWRF